MSLLISNGTIITEKGPFAGNLFIDGEKISAIGTTPQSADRIIDATGKLVIPGGIDVHTHLNLKVGSNITADDFYSGTRAAAFGGTTTIIDFAQPEKGESLRDAFEKRLVDAKKSVVDYGLHMVIVNLPDDRLEETDEMLTAGITTFKLFTAYPNRLMADDETIFNVLRQTKRNGGLVITHAEDASMIDASVKQLLADGKIEPKYHAYSRSTTSEARAVKRVINLAKKASAPVYFVHISCSDSIEIIKQAQAEGYKVYAETCPQYLFTSLDDFGKDEITDLKYIFTPPPRDKANQELLWQALNDNTLQVVSTDHCPFNLTTKKEAAQNNFTAIPNGTPGIEHRLELIYHFGVLQKRISLNRWVELCSTNPAKLFGLYPRKGSLNVGSDADIVIWNPETKRTISASTHHMQVDHSLYEGWEIQGQAETVISRGKIIVENGIFHASAGQGKFLKRFPQ